MAIDLKALEKLLSIVKKHHLAELEVEDGKLRYRIKTSHAPNFNAEAMSSVTSLVEAAPPLSESPKKLHASSEDRYVKILSPFVGTFYRAPSPEADSYVQEGQVVKKSDVLCIVEAMKLMNEIECEAPGKIVSILVENGQPVEYGEPLFLIDPL